MFGSTTRDSSLHLIINNYLVFDFILLACGVEKFLVTGVNPS